MAKTLSNYNPTVNIGGGITPAGGEFPVAESHDILVDSTGKRLDAKLDELDAQIGGTGETSVATQLGQKVAKSDITTGAPTSTNTDAQVPSTKSMYTALATKPTGTLSTAKPVSGSTDTQIPTSKAVYTGLAEKVNTADVTTGAPASTNTDAQVPSTKSMYTALATKPTGTLSTAEPTSSSTDTQIPTAKAVYTGLNKKVNTADIASTVAATGSTSATKVPSETAVREAIEAKTIPLESSVPAAGDSPSATAAPSVAATRTAIDAAIDDASQDFEDAAAALQTSYNTFTSAIDAKIGDPTDAADDGATAVWPRLKNAETDIDALSGQFLITDALTTAKMADNTRFYIYTGKEIHVVNATTDITDTTGNIIYKYIGATSGNFTKNNLYQYDTSTSAYVAVTAANALNITVEGSSTAGTIYRPNYWFYYDTNTWKQGSNVSSVTVDSTLSIAGAAADAKATGDAITELSNDVSKSLWGSTGEPTEEAKYSNFNSINYKTINFINYVAEPDNCINFISGYNAVIGYGVDSNDSDTYKYPVYGNRVANTNVIIVEFNLEYMQNIDYIIVPTFSGVGQKIVFYKLDHTAAGSISYATDNGDGTTKIDIKSIVNLNYDRVVISLNEDIYYVKYVGIKDNTIWPPERSVSIESINWDDKISINAIKKDSAFQSSQIFADYIIPHTIPDGFLLNIEILNATPGRYYKIYNTYKNHNTNKTRSFNIQEFTIDSEGNITNKSATGVIFDNENGDDPTYVEYISEADINKFIQSYSFRALINWNNGNNNYLSTGVINPLLYRYKSQDASSSDTEDSNDINVDNFNNYLLSNSFFGTGNIVSLESGKHEYSNGYNTETRLPILHNSDLYRSYKIDIPNNGYIEIPLNSWEKSNYATCQSYFMIDDLCYMNYVNTGVSGSGIQITNNGRTVDYDNNILRYDCAKIRSNGYNKLYFCCPVDAITSGAFYIKYINAYLPTWLDVSSILENSSDTDPVEIVCPTDIYVMNGVEFSIYYQNIFRYYDVRHFMMATLNSNMFFDYNHEFARWRDDSDTTADNTKFIINFFEKNTQSAKYQTPQITKHNVPVNAGSGITKKILFIGDSLTDAGTYSATIKQLFEQDTMNIELLGTRDTNTGNNEGYSGWRAYTYVCCPSNVEDWATFTSTVPNRIPNPFYNESTETFDFSMYMNNNNYASVDYVFICLGTNDIARGNHQSNEEIISYWNTMINSIKDFDQNIKIGLWMPPSRNLADNRNVVDPSNALKINKLILDTWNNMQSNNIYIVPTNLNVDPYYDYNYTEENRNARNTEAPKIRTAGDGVHPKAIGYQHMADVFYPFIKYLASLDE